MLRSESEPRRAQRGRVHAAVALLAVPLVIAGVLAAGASSPFRVLRCGDHLIELQVRRISAEDLRDYPQGLGTYLGSGRFHSQDMAGRWLVDDGRRPHYTLTVANVHYDLGWERLVPDHPESIRLLKALIKRKRLSIYRIPAR
jgi:hypothetical protein